MVLAANTPMMLKAGLVEGDTDAGVLASGQVVGVIDDLPTCEELIDRVVTRAVDELRRAAATSDRRLTLRSALELQLAAHDPVAEQLVDADHVVVGLGVPGVDRLAAAARPRQPAAVMSGLEQQAEPVAAVRAHHRGVVLVAELGRSASTATTVWPASSPVSRCRASDPVEPVPRASCASS